MYRKLGDGIVFINCLENEKNGNIHFLFDYWLDNAVLKRHLEPVLDNWEWGGVYVMLI